MLPEDGEGLLVLKSREQVWAGITRKWEEKVRLSVGQLLKPLPDYYLVPRLIETGLIQRPLPVGSCLNPITKAGLLLEGSPDEYQHVCISGVF